MSQCAVIIPARLGATRLPSKPLAEIHGKPMILHVLERAQAAQVGPVIVACAEAELKEVVEKAGGQAVLTDPQLPSGTDRVHAALKVLGKESFERVLNLQGDLPNINPETIRAVADCLVQTQEPMATAACVIEDKTEINNPNVVKIAMVPHKNFHRALYFSRSSIPSGDGPFYHHIGLYGFQREALERFVSLPPSSLEVRERLEQLRALEAGMNICVTVVSEAPVSIDTQDDLNKIRNMNF